ncbi:hypothetical protein [Nocardia aurea]|uniref:Ig-like domain-containing protein n=1 Tax=Nocardia aurea TaxID=2144174 RepID=A0ABV3G2B8_9NOCA
MNCTQANTLSGVCLLAMWLISAAPATAAETAVDLGTQCATQYPDTPTMFAATPTLVAPGNAYSWRCEQRLKLPGGGVIANLPVDAGRYCADHGLGHAVVLDSDDPQSWRCRA